MPAKVWKLLNSAMVLNLVPRPTVMTPVLVNFGLEPIASDCAYLHGQNMRLYNEFVTSISRGELLILLP